jgi:hypothetical protein
MLASRARNTSVVNTPRQRSTTAPPGDPHVKVETPTSHHFNGSVPDLVAETRSVENDHPPKLDDLDLMICHEEFTNLVALANKVKQVEKAQQSCASASAYYEMNRREIANSSLAPAEVVAAVERMQEQLSVKNVVIRRGMYPLTDAMMDDNFSILQQELEYCECCLRKAKKQSKHAASPGGGGNGDAIVAKYPKWQTDILMKWVIDHKDDPRPDNHQIEKLSAETGLTRSQIVNWTTNVRKRNRKATLDGKKPHHFIDFVFLAQERDKSQGGVSNPTTGSATPPIETPRRRKKLRVLRTPGSSQQSSPHPSPIQSQAPSSFSTPQHRYSEASPGYHHPPTPYIPYTPLSQRLPSPQHGGNVYSTPAQWSNNWGTANNKKRRRPSTKISNSAAWQKKLKSVTESFEEPVGGDSMEPIIIDDDLDEDILSVFASSWKGTLLGDKDDVKPPQTLSSSNDMDVKIKQEDSEDDGAELPALDELTLGPPDLIFYSSFDWKEIDMTSLDDEAGIIKSKDV